MSLFYMFFLFFDVIGWMQNMKGNEGYVINKKGMTF